MKKKIHCILNIRKYTLPFLNTDNIVVKIHIELISQLSNGLTKKILANSFNGF